MSALDLFVGDWLRDRIAAKLAERRPGPSPRGPVEVLYGADKDSHFQAQQEERVVVGLQPQHRLGRIEAGAPGRRALDPERPGEVAAPFATLKQGFVIYARVLPPPGTPEVDRVREAQRRAFSLVRDVLIGIDTARDVNGEAAHGSHSLAVDGVIDISEPEEADYTHGCLAKVRVSIAVPVLGEEARVIRVEVPPAAGQTGVAGVVEACNPSGDDCTTVAEIGQ